MADRLWAFLRVAVPVGAGIGALIAGITWSDWFFIAAGLTALCAGAWELTERRP